MELIKNKYKIRCEMGACRNMADYVLVMDRSGIHSSICMCAECAEKLKAALCSEPKVSLRTSCSRPTRLLQPVAVRKKRKIAGSSAVSGEESA